jgi:hypothetical protein
VAGPEDPAAFDYDHPTRNCDVVMKGGITSGVVYPHAICELARTYRLRNVGGTSVGAVAAAGAAAAEYGRGDGGFRKLAGLPRWLGEGSNLSDLFQPQPETRPAFRILLASLGPGGWRRVLRLGGAAISGYWLGLIVGALPGVALILLAALTPPIGWLAGAAVAAGVVLGVLGAVIGGSLQAVLTVPRAISANGFGLCSGMPVGDQDGPAMTPWLADEIDTLAGRPKGGPPLTFGDLTQRDVELTMITTNLTHRRAHRLPMDRQIFFFDADEWRRLFPERVVAWLEQHPPPLDSERDEDSARVREAMLPRLPLPRPQDLPVVVAARMSLSFPLLISAVPLWAFDRTSKSNNEALREDAAPDDRPVPERCWFSDGGISSNFPVHFFDAPLPTWPTFAIDLDGFHPDYPKSAEDETKNVYLPDTNFSTLLGNWYRFPDPPGIGRLASFLDGMVRTMQNRVDTTLARQPGYRDRIVHVHIDGDEGGMNLKMPAPVIEALVRRGQAAGRRLVERFAETPGTAPGMSWDNHRWVRYRAAMATLADFLTDLAAAWREAPPPDERTYQQLVDRGSDTGPNSYRFRRNAQRDLANDTHGRLVDAGSALMASTERLDDGAPRPLARVRIAPRE